MNPEMFRDQPHLNLRALGFSAACLMLLLEHGDPMQPKSTHPPLQKPDLLNQEIKPGRGRSGEGKYDQRKEEESHHDDLRISFLCTTFCVSVLALTHLYSVICVSFCYF